MKLADSPPSWAAAGVGVPGRWRSKNARRSAPGPASAQGKRVTRRSTLWQHTAGRWKVLYHQGTIVVDTQPHASG